MSQSAVGPQLEVQLVGTPQSLLGDSGRPDILIQAVTTPVEQLTDALGDRSRIERRPVREGGKAARSGDAPPRAPPRGYYRASTPSS
ncbi:MAG: hypothetical protein ABIW94_02540 [Gemmatimonadaceae bacterium]